MIPLTRRQRIGLWLRDKRSAVRSWFVLRGWIKPKWHEAAAMNVRKNTDALLVDLLYEMGYGRDGCAPKED